MINQYFYFEIQTYKLELKTVTMILGGEGYENVKKKLYTFFYNLECGSLQNQLHHIQTNVKQ